IQVVPDRRYVSFMWSYPNLIPLGAPGIRRIVSTLQPFHFDRIYGAWWGANIGSNAKLSIANSAERYLRAIGS
ncbi:MAG: MBL fold metallo-hydrolase, partial [Acidobacteria bacterium]